jgi:uncharacterized protein YndB with AHSA1/START domain
LPPESVNARFARVRTTFVVRASPERTFAYIADPSNTPEWWPNLAARWKPADEPPLGVGTGIRWVGNLLGRRVEVRERITVFEPGSALETRHEAGFEGCVSWTFAAVPEGTRVQFAWTYEPPAAVVQSFKDPAFVRQAIGADIRHGLRNLRRILNHASVSS